jgi:hypothetical protein
LIKPICAASIDPIGSPVNNISAARREPISARANLHCYAATRHFDQADKPTGRSINLDRPVGYS